MKADKNLKPIIQVAAAATAAPDVTLLVNNAGYAAFQGAIAAPDLSAARREMDVNYFGPLALTRTFKPALACAWAVERS
jgi:NAD(P)-dependent dehydrogenase (short-subunit alcohol dehydrogenase family)